MSESETFRVLHVTETLPGGVAVYLTELLSLHKDAPAIAEIRVLAPREQLSHLRDLPTTMLRGYERTGRNLRSLLKLALALRAQAREFRPQIIHLHSSFAGVVGRLLRPWLPAGVRMVYCPHGWGFSRDDNRILRWVYSWVERWLARRADAWVAISQHELHVAQAAGIDSTHAHVVLNGVGDTRDWQVPSLPAMDAGYLNLLFVGRHDRQKGLDILLAVMARLGSRKIRLYVAGAAGVDSSSDVRRVDTGNVSWLGWLSRSELVAYYRACDVVVVPSRWEGFGLVAIESLREGKPVIASRCGGLVEIVGGCGSLVPSGSADVLFSLLETLDRQQVVAWSRDARARYLSRFTATRMAAETMALYFAICSEDSRSAR